DVDRFKTINDKYGHIVGDKVLREIGQTLTKCVRKMDLVVRYGGDEFLIMLSDTDKSKAKRIANRLAKRVSEIIIPELDEQITISFGISVYDGSKSLEDVLKIADRTMYKQKRRGAR
ncbi:MAG TPA: GGDEF domain-containing protein, partial [Pseudothermotoga sp.]|nr:GGDEF domain-containing protein [Pseudothermotoga sp.]